ncbi:MAG: type IV pilus assembly protein PilM [Candidatus Omnitrophica bacterium]|nr:type IV pilus assembly protein PilM [Candidatus Omnitrophota bacterium]
MPRPVKGRDTIGLDVGSHSIKTVVVDTSKTKPVLSAYNVKLVPSGKKKIPIDQLIKELFDEINIKPSEINLSISGGDVIVRFITLPRMDKASLEESMVFEADRYIPFNVNEVIMDFAILDDAGEGKMNVLLAAAKSDFVEGQLELFRKIGIRVNLMDINAFSVFNAFSMSNDIDPVQGTGFFDLGHSQTTVMIATGKMPRFMRVIQTGGKDITKAISEDMGVTQEEAENIKYDQPKGMEDKVARATSVVIDELVKEMQLSFSYFENKYGKGIDHIYCSGGMVYQKGVQNIIGEKLGLKVNGWDVLGGLSMADSLSREALSGVSSQLAAAIGLGLRG